LGGREVTGWRGSDDQMASYTFRVEGPTEDPRDARRLEVQTRKEEREM